MVTWIDEGRSQATVGKFFDELGPERTKKLEFVTMDMSAPFIANERTHCPPERNRILRIHK